MTLVKVRNFPNHQPYRVLLVLLDRLTFPIHPSNETHPVFPPKAC